MRAKPAYSVFLICILAWIGSRSFAEEPARIARHPHVDDVGPATGFQESWGNHHRRGRALVAEDFDGDGFIDYFVGNVGEESVVVRNLGPGAGHLPRFEPAQTLLDGELAFVAAAADYDNDGDLDLFVGCGGLEGYCLDSLFRNDSTPGRILFTDVSDAAGVRGPSFRGAQLVHATGGATWGDYDRDGDPDLFVSLIEVPHGTIRYKGVMWSNNGDGTFLNATYAANLDYWAVSGGTTVVDWGYFQNSTWIDFDNDGDLDLFLNNGRGPNVLWKSYLVESGRPWFKDRTSMYSLPGENLSFPYHSFASAVSDFNNDGWQDLILFNSSLEPMDAGGSPYGNGHGLFLNDHGRGFYNVSDRAGINMPDGEEEHAMGCQVADLDADGTPDLVIGAGDPAAGGMSRLLLSNGTSGEIPLYEDASHLIDFEPQHGIDPTAAPYPEIPPYPYRTHGIAAADFDGDGRLELGVLNGGRAIDASIVREPDQLFDFSGPGVGKTFRVRLRGNGVTDGRDAIGARAYVEIASPKGTRRVFQTVLAGSGFSAQNERTLTFGLGHDRAERLVVLWPSGCVQIVDGLPSRSSAAIVVEEACSICSGTTPWLDPDAALCTGPAPDRAR